MTVHGSIWGPPRPKSYLERLEEEQKLRQRRDETEPEHILERGVKPDGAEHGERAELARVKR
jgi:hypothetical protein